MSDGLKWTRTISFEPFVNVILPYDAFGETAVEKVFNVSMKKVKNMNSWDFENPIFSRPLLDELDLWTDWYDIGIETAADLHLMLFTYL